MNKYSRWVSLSLFLLQVPVAQAAWKIDRVLLELSPPPARGSSAERRDFATLLRVQAERTEEQCAIANAQSFASMRSLFAIPPRVLTTAELARVETFGQAVIDTLSKAADPFKKRWERARPYDTNSEIEPCVRLPGGRTSYPSSHAAMGVVLGDLLGRVFPEKRAALERRGIEIGDNRVLGGVHHPSDIEAGRELGHQVQEQLEENAEFRRELGALVR